jgi:hypothetical protein
MNKAEQLIQTCNKISEAGLLATVSKIIKKLELKPGLGVDKIAKAVMKEIDVSGPDIEATVKSVVQQLIDTKEV